MEVSKTVKNTAGGSAILTVLTLAIAFAEDIKGLLNEVPVVGMNAEVRALEEKHESDIAAITTELRSTAEWSRKSYGNGLPGRILSLLKHKCANLDRFLQDPSREMLLNELLDDYKAINERTYPVGTCNSLGQYCNVMGTCHQLPG